MVRKGLVISVLAMAAAISTASIGAENISVSTKQDLLAAMKDEAFSHLRYKLFAGQARKNGNAALADLFEKIAAAEFEKHFKEQAQILGLVKSDKENLTAAISDEYLETVKMYADMAKRAEAAGDSAIAQHFATAAADEGEHQKAFKAILSKRSSSPAD
jgi:rubrerythrin